MRLQVWLPESPRWLLLAGRHEDAREALVWTRGKPAKEDEMALTEEFDDIKKSSAETMPHQGDHWKISTLKISLLVREGASACMLWHERTISCAGSACFACIVCMLNSFTHDERCFNRGVPVCVTYSAGCRMSSSA